MNESNELRFQPAKISSASGLAVRGALGAMIATVIALAAFGVIGIIFTGVIGLYGVAFAARSGLERAPSSWVPGPGWPEFSAAGSAESLAGISLWRPTNSSCRVQCNGRT
jgi:hypothetical protein